MSSRKKCSVVAGYEVGYGKPPKSKRFRKGRSGNPKGRPKGARNKPVKGLIRVRDMLLAEAEREVMIQDKEGPLMLPIAQAAMRSLGLKAAQGNVGAQKLFLGSIAAAEADKEREDLETLQNVADYKEWAYAEIARRKREDIEAVDDILPHPDHIEVDARTGELLFTGPADKNDKKKWDELWARKADLEEEVEDHKKLIADPETSEDMKQFLENDLKLSMYMLQLAEQGIILRWYRSVREVVTDRSRRRETKHRIKNGVWPERPSGKKSAC